MILSQRVTYKTETYLVPVVTVNCPEEHISCKPTNPRDYFLLNFL